MVIFTPFLVLYGTYAVIQASLGAYVLARAILARLPFAAFLAAAFLNVGIETGIVILGAPVPFPVKLVMYMNYPLFYTFFTKLAYHAGKPSAFLPVLAVVIVLRCVYTAWKIIFNFTVPPVHPVGVEHLPFYVIHLLLLAGMHVTPLAWLVASAVATHRSAGSSRVEPWIRKRNLLAGAAALVLLVVPAAWVFMPVDGSTESILVVNQLAHVIIFLALGSSFINMTCWITPSFLVQLLNEGNPIPAVIRPVASLDSTEGDLVSGSRPNRNVMTIIDAVGNVVATRIGRPPGAVKGLLFMVIQEWHGGKPVHVLTLDQAKEVISGPLKDRLARSGIHDVDSVIDAALAFLRDNQTLLFLSQV